MNTKEFLYVVTIFEEKSLTKAAEKLFLSQPSLSKYIIGLEEGYGLRIFVRSTTPWGLTDFGEEYIRIARKALSLNRILEQKGQDIKNFKSGRLKVGMPVTRSSYLLPKVLPSFKENYPSIDIRIIEESSSVLEDMLLKGKIDLAIFYQDEPNPLLNYELISREKLYLVTAPGYLTGTYPNQPFEDLVLNNSLEGKPFILLNPWQRTRKIADRIFVDYGLKPEIYVYSRQLEVSAKLCINALGITFVTETMRSTLLNNSTYHNADFYPLNEYYALPVVTAARKDFYTPKISQYFTDLVKQVYNT